MTAKHRSKPYLPDSDVGKAEWMKRFLSIIERDPEHYGFCDPSMFEYYVRTIRTFIKAVETVRNPATRTPGAVRAKNDARKEAVQMCRNFAMQLKWDTTITDEEKKALGLHIDERPRESAKLPAGAMPGATGFPLLAVMNSPSGGHVIRFRDPSSPSKAKPKGVSHLLLFGAIGDKPRMSRAHARLLGAYTRRVFEVMYPTGCGLEGLYVTYYARWLTTRGEMSPWSPPVSKIIGDTQVSLRESVFGHLFDRQGFIDAVPQLPDDTASSVAQLEAALQPQQRQLALSSDERRLLEGAVGEGDSLFAAIEAKMFEASTVRLVKAA